MLSPILKSLGRAGCCCALLGPTGLAGRATQTVQYRYDEAGRLAAIDYGGGQGIIYSYDAAGNLLKRAVTRFPDSDEDLLDDRWEQQ